MTTAKLVIICLAIARAALGWSNILAESSQTFVQQAESACDQGSRDGDVEYLDEQRKVFRCR